MYRRDIDAREVASTRANPVHGLSQIYELERERERERDWQREGERKRERGRENERESERFQFEV